MADNCYYEMKVVGKKSDCEGWLKKMKDYEEENHFFRIFCSEVFDQYFDENDHGYICISGDCAWSIESCCRSGYTSVDLFAVNTRDLKLQMEVYSSEPGCQFQEHYLYENGECIEAECVEWQELIYDRNDYKTFAEFKKDWEIPDNIKEEDFNEDGICEIGGFGEWSFSI